MARSPLQTQNRIQQQLRSMLGTWWPVGTRLPPTKILAQWLGTGTGNTFRAVRALAAEGFLTSRPSHGTFVVRVPSSDAARDISGDQPDQAPRPSEQAKVALVTSPSHRHVTDLIDARLRTAGFQTAVIFRPDVTNDLASFVPRDFGAAVLIYPDIYSPVRFAANLCVMVFASTAFVPVIPPVGFDVVSPDDAQGARLAGERARQARCHHPCFVGRAAPIIEAGYDETSAARLRSFEEGLGRRLPDGFRLQAMGYDERSGEKAAVQALALDPRPDFVFAACDELALGFMLATATRGVHAGRDYTLVGFDGDPEGRTVPGGPLSTVLRPEECMIKQAVEYLIDRLRQPDQPPRRTLFGCAFFEGATTGSSPEIQADPRVPQERI